MGKYILVKVLIYMEPGDTYVDGSTVPAKRVGIFLRDAYGAGTGIQSLSADGLKIYDGAVCWASGIYGGCPNALKIKTGMRMRTDTTILYMTLKS